MITLFPKPVLTLACALVLVPQLAHGVPQDAVASDDLGGRFIERRELIQSALEYNPELLDAGIVLLQVSTRGSSAHAPFDWVLEAGSSVQQSLRPNPFLPEELRRNTTAESHMQLARLLRTGTQLRLRVAESFTQYPLYNMGPSTTQLELTIPEGTLVPDQPEITFPVLIRDTSPAQPRYADLFSTTTDLSITQPLLKGAGTDVLDGPLRTARAARRRAEAQRRQTATRVVAQVLRLAAQLALARTDRTLRLAARDLAQEELDVTRAKIAAGQLAEIAELQIRQTIAEREEASLLAERSIRDLDAELKRAIGEEVAPGHAPLNPEALGALVGEFPDPEQILQRALLRSPEIGVAQATLDESRAALAATRNGLLPRLDASAGVGVIAQDQNGLAVWERMLNVKDGFNWHAGLAFALPLQNQEAWARAEESRLAAERAELALDTVRDRLRVDIAKASHELTAAEKRIRVAGQARNLAARTAEGEAERYHLGLTTAHDLLDAQERLRAAEFSLRRAEHDKAVAELKLLELSGDLLDVLDVRPARIRR